LLAPRQTITGDALKQPSAKTQENLLADLMSESTDRNSLLKLSQFRPGVFSDFQLTVELRPNNRIELMELDLEVTTEAIDAPVGEWILCARTNLGLPIEISVSRKDVGGHSGGIGTYVGVFDSQDPVSVSVPKKHGDLMHTAWFVDGKKSPGGSQSEVKRSCFIVAHYEPADKVL
jgi:hypothetical protein